MNIPDRLHELTKILGSALVRHTKNTMLGMFPVVAGASHGNERTNGWLRCVASLLANFGTVIHPRGHAY